MVCRRLTTQARRFPDLRIDALNTDGLDVRDAALACAIDDAVIRRWLTLGWLLDRFLKKPLSELEPAMQAVLLSGAAQIMLLDRVPVHAAINESVVWAKRAIRPGAGGMVNAVLRRIAQLKSPDGAEVDHRPRWTDRRDEIPLADGSAIGLGSAILPEDTLIRWAFALSCPLPLLRHWARTYPLDRVRDLAWHGLDTGPVILNATHAQTPLPDDLLLPHAEAGFFVFTSSRSALVNLLRRRDDVWVQDSASSAGVRGASHLRPRLIVDLCAGQGTKTRQLAATFGEAKLIATDRDPNRVTALRRVFKGHARVRVVPLGALRRLVSQEGGGGGGDLVLLDVPCSNTGVLARRVEAKYRASGETLKSLVEIQREIISEAMPLLRMGGRILYSTCSLEPEENQEQASWMKRSFGLHLDRQGSALPAGGPPAGASAMSEYRDGSYWALLARGGGARRGV